MIADFLKQQGNAGIILSIAIILLAGFLCTRVTKRLRFPNVSGYIISGILIGPCVLQMIPEEVVAGMDFMTDIALAFIAFGVGKYFKRWSLHYHSNGNTVPSSMVIFTTAGCHRLCNCSRFHDYDDSPVSCEGKFRGYHPSGNCA